MNSLTLNSDRAFFFIISSTGREGRLWKLPSVTSKPFMPRSPKLHREMYSSFQTFRSNSTASYPGFSPLLREKTLVAAGHVIPKIWKPKIGEGKKSISGLNRVKQR